jgi:hypothetical protein
MLPHLLGGLPQIVGAALPIVTAPDVSGNKTGLGDLNLIDLALFKRSGLALGFGPQLTVPTATDSLLAVGRRFNSGRGRQIQAVARSLELSAGLSSNVFDDSRYLALGYTPAAATSRQPGGPKGLDVQ